MQRDYRVTLRELLLGRCRSRVSIENSVGASLRFGFCCIVNFGLVKHRMGAFENEFQRGLLDVNKIK